MSNEDPQRIWLAEAYSFLNGGYPYSSLYLYTPVLTITATGGASISGNIPVIINYPGGSPFTVYLDGSYVGICRWGSFSFNALGGYHDIRVWDGNFNYEQSVLFPSSVPMIIYAGAV